jgi:hypothetical protein
MRDDLFFIPILSEALRYPDPETRIRQAIAQIVERGSDPRYRVGFEQFLRFIEAAATIDSTEQEALMRVALRLLLARVERDVAAPGPRHSGSLAQTGAHAACAQAIQTMREVAIRSELIMLQVERNGQAIASLSLPQASPAIIRRIQPGAYIFTLDTGLRLWTGELLPSDLLWRRAFPSKPLRLAADSAPPPMEPTRRIPLRVGFLTAVVYPGVEAGTIHIVSGEALA